MSTWRRVSLATSLAPTHTDHQVFVADELGHA